MAIQLHPSIATHPGEFIFEEFIKPYGLTIKATAKHLGYTRPPMSNLLNGKAALSPEMARRFEKAFGVKAATLLRMQAAYDLAQLELAGDEPNVKPIPAPLPMPALA